MWGALIGAGASLVGSYMSQQSEKKSAEKANKISKAQFKKVEAFKLGQLAWKKKLDERKVRTTAEAVAGKQRTRYAAAGVKAHAHSADIMVRETYKVAKQDLNIINEQYKLDKKAASMEAKFGIQGLTQPPDRFAATMLTAGGKFVAGGFGEQGGGWYGLKF